MSEDYCGDNINRETIHGYYNSFCCHLVLKGVWLQYNLCDLRMKFGVFLFFISLSINVTKLDGCA